MDRHDVAHYLIAAALGAGGLWLYERAPIPGAWPSLSSSDIVSLSASIKATGVKGIDIYCGDPRCSAIAADVDLAISAAGVVTTLQPAIIVPDGLTVGAETQDAENKLAAAIYEGSRHKLRPETSRIGNDRPYISFGRPK